MDVERVDNDNEQTHDANLQEDSSTKQVTEQMDCEGAIEKQQTEHDAPERMDVDEDDTMTSAATSDKDATTVNKEIESIDTVEGIVRPSEEIVEKEIVDSAEQIVDNAEQINDNAEQINDNAEQINDNTEQINDNAQQVHNNVEQTTYDTAEVVDATKEIPDTVEQNSNTDNLQLSESGAVEEASVETSEIVETIKQPDLANKDNQIVNEIATAPEETENVTRNTLFVNSDSNVTDQSNGNDADLEVDPIAAPQSSINEADPEMISGDNTDDVICLNDAVTGNETDNFVIAKYNLSEEKNCMVCSKRKVPSYSCTNKTDEYICSEECIDKFKKDNEGKYIIQGIRVKTFNMYTSETTSSELSERCKACNKTVGSFAVSFASFTFCDVTCLKKFYRSNCGNCEICAKDVNEEYLGKYWIRDGLKFRAFCTYTCYLSFKKPENLCKFCKMILPVNEKEYCDSLCTASYGKITRTRECSVCHNEKPVEIELIKDEGSNYFCSDPCFVAYKFVNKSEPKQCEVCHRFVKAEILQPNSITGQTSIINICSEKCRSIYIFLKGKDVNCQVCSSKKNNFNSIKKKNSYYCSLYCYEKLYIKKYLCANCKVMAQISIKENSKNFCNFYCYNHYKMYEEKFDESGKGRCQFTAYYYHYNENGTITRIPLDELICVKPPQMIKRRNIATMVRPNQMSKSITCKPRESNKSVQTDDVQIKTLVVPIPIPIFIPLPTHMYVEAFPMPFPVPIPIPVPILIPTTRNSVKGIIKEINKVKNKVPADPLEAEILMMAEMVAEDKKDDSNSSDDEEPENFNNEPSNNFGDDVLQMALKMASDFEEPVDLEGEVSVSTIGPNTSRTGTTTETYTEPTAPRKRGRPKSVKRTRVEVSSSAINQSTAATQKPDANLCLKYTFGVNAWKQWVTTKNNELEKASKRPKLFKAELLQLTADELNYSLCLFVKEVRKPNGAEYAPDTIYYLCLGVQQYLYENNRIDNIFCDPFYEKFTDCLNEVCKKFSLLYNESQYIVTRVEEEHLWESKQLGAHSPLVLLNTLMFFNTKHFSLTSVEEHLQLSFSHIMKHWKRNPHQPGTRNVLLRFYPPQNFQMENKKKKMYEQQENEDNPIRCPVKLYEFYLSKCPESVKTRNDVFYLLPERSCVPDSPLWYSTMALDQKSLDKMLNRVKMVKEINIALLSN